MPVREKTNHRPGIQDTFQTPPHAVDCVLEHIDRYRLAENPEYHNTIIWECAAGKDQLLVKRMRKEGFTVIATDIQYGEEFDFFTYVPARQYDVMITNPPYSNPLKYAWIERSFELGRPFALLLPSDTFDADRFVRVFERYHKNPWEIEVISPRRRINFKTPNRGWVNSSAQMHTSWLTWGLHVGQTRTPGLYTYYTSLPNIKYNENDEEIL